MEHKCIKEGDIAAIKENIINLYKKQDAHDKRMEKIEIRTDAQYEMAKSIAVMAEKMTTISEDVKEVKNDVNALKKEVREKREEELEDEIGIFRKYKSQIITLIITAVVTYYLAKIGG